MSSIVWKARARETITWVAIFSVYYGSLVPYWSPRSAYATEVEKDKSVPESPAASDVVSTSVTEIPTRSVEEERAALEGRIAERVQSFMLAQATTEPTSDATASKMLVDARAASFSGNHVGAALLAFGVAEQFGGTPESMSAIRLLTEYSERMQKGEFSQQLIDLFEAGLPKYEILPTLESKYVLLAFWVAAAQFAESKSDTTRARNYASKAVEHLRSFMEAYPNSPLQVYAVTYLAVTSEILGPDEKENALEGLRISVEEAQPSALSCAAHGLLGKLYAVHGDYTSAKIQWLALRRQWDEIGGPALLSSAEVPYEAKTHLLMYLGLAQRGLGDYEAALASFEAAATGLPDAGFPTESAVIYAARLRHQLDIDSTDATLASYAEFLAQRPESVFKSDVMLDVADVHIENNNYDAAYVVYEDLARSNPNAKAGAAAESGLDYLIQRELAIASDGEGTAAILAMACGPMALHDLLAHQGVKSTVPELIRLAKTRKSGTSMKNLIAAAAAKGFVLDGVRAAALDELAPPFIAFVKADHFVMVESFDTDSVMVRDMAKPARAVARVEFEAEWSGDALAAPGAYRLAKSLSAESLSEMTGGTGGVSCTDQYGSIIEQCRLVPEDGGVPLLCPDQPAPAVSCSSCGCTGAPGGVNGENVPPTDCSIDPWLSGPGMPASGLHQSSPYIDVGIPGHIGNVYVQPFLSETRIDRTDMVVRSRGTLTFNLTQSYSNPHGGTRLWIDKCVAEGFDEVYGWNCSSRMYLPFGTNQDPPVWKTNIDDYRVLRKSSTVLLLYRHWSQVPAIYNYVPFSADVYAPTDGSKDTEIVSGPNGYTLSRDDGYHWGFNEDGRMVSISDATGNFMHYTARDAAHRVTQIDLPPSDGRIIAISYPSTGMIIELKQGATTLRKVEYINGADSDRQYMAVKYDDKEIVRYYHTTQYARSSVVLSAIPPMNTAPPGGGANDRGDIYEMNWIDEIRDAKGNSYLFGFDELAFSLGGPRLMTVTLPNGLQTKIDRSFDSSVLNSREVSVTSGGEGSPKTIYKRDEAYRLSERHFYRANQSDMGMWKYFYALSGMLERVESPGATAGTTVVYGRLSYNSENMLTAVKRGPGTSPSTYTYVYTSGYPYPTKMIDPTGVETTWTYDPNNRTMLSSYKPPAARASANGFVLTRNAYGEVSSVVDPYSKSWGYTYDQFGNLATATTPLSETVTLTWNALGQMTTVLDPMSKRTEFSYITGGCQSCGPSGLLQQVRRYFMNGQTEDFRLTEFAYDANGSVTDVTDPGSDVVHYAYDSMNQVTAVTYPYGTAQAKTTNVYWMPYGRVGAVTDAASKSTSFAYDEVYRLKQVNDPLAGGATLLAYDAFGNLSAVTDDLGHSWSYTYSDRQWLTDITDSLGKNLHYVLNDAGRVTQVSAGTGGVGSSGTYPIAYTYDTGSNGKGTLTRVDYGASGAGGFAAFTYDHLGALKTLNDNFKSFFGLSAMSYDYDDAGKLTALHDQGQTLSYAYNPAGAITSMTDWEGTVTGYGYNDLHELTALTFLQGTSNAKTWNFDYNAAGQPESYSHPNGMVTDYVYDSNGVMTDLLHKNGSTVKQGFSYLYDDVFNITRQTHEDGSYWTYTYDNRYRLTGAVRHNANDTIQANYAYAYDNGDNMLTKTEPWEDDFADGNVSDDGWSTSGSSWTASAGTAVATPTGSHANRWVSTVDDNVEVDFTYALNSTSSNSYAIRVEPRYASGSNRVQLNFYPNKIDLLQCSSGTWSTLSSNTSATSTQGAAYKVRIETDGSAIRVYRRPASGGVETLVHNVTTAVSGHGAINFNGLVNGSYMLDDVRILASDSALSRTTSLYYRTNNEIDYTTDYNGTTNYTFDAWGRTNTEAKNGVTKTYSWMSANLLGGINSSDPNEVDVAYNYTGDLKRVWRFENSTLTNAYQWDAGFNVLNEGTTGNPLKTFVPGLAEVSGNNLASSATYNYLTTDHLSSARGLWDGAQTQTGSWEFTPYGSPYNFAGPPDVTQLFTGHDSDRVTGQAFAAFRYLNSNNARWASSDPAGMVDGPNMFAYIGGDPINSSDPVGLRRKQDPGDDLLSEFGLDGDRLNNARAGSWAPIAPAIDDRGKGAVGGAASFYKGLTGLDMGCNPAPSVGAEGIGSAINMLIAGMVMPVGGGAKSGFRAGLIRISGRDPGPLFHAHHVFPRKFFKGTALMGSRYGAWYSAGAHLRDARRYNQRWAEFLEDSRSIEAILQFGRDLSAERGLTVFF